ncbi:hypothetical protein SOVF_156940 [Spinacia oleracea]|uniref:Uncharacterized protein n=1 Tax=Spinacia oleracea TaxID=3562 RepID=A0A9R0KB43_SPIOL|nr:uncharacterized protein LOC110803916 [Spinacia oleracea]KNA09074.1 hypothetical protein SOVF_156940 [Spinacia oleracea]
MRMRLSSISKPISSPGRTDKFPPPLMRFLRSNVGSRSSRGRTRRRPLFMRRKKSLTAASAIETTQEPSSPKVTCIGQVRVRRSKSKNRNKSSQVSKTTRSQKCSGNENDNGNVVDESNNSCCCLNLQKFCKLKLCCKPKFRKWVLFFNCRSVKVRTNSSKFGSSRFEQDDEQQGKEVVRVRDEERRVSISIETEMTTTTTTPPKNALLLTRSRSAPYRSSSLACRFLGSPSREESEKVELENRASGIEVSRDSTSSESREDRDSIEGRRSSSSTNISLKNDMGSCAQVVKLENEKSIVPDSNGDDGFGKRLMLMRCKSEPARKESETVDPLSSEFWRHRRSGNTESSTIHSHAID